MLLAGKIPNTSTRCMDFVEIFNIVQDLSTICFSLFSGCRASIVCSCHPIQECCNLFSGVGLSMRSLCFIYPASVFCKN